MLVHQMEGISGGARHAIDVLLHDKKVYSKNMMDLIKDIIKTFRLDTILSCH